MCTETRATVGEVDKDWRVSDAVFRSEVESNVDEGKARSVAAW